MTIPAGHHWLNAVTALGSAVALIVLVALCTPRHPNSIRRRPDGRNIKRGNEE